jgi:hypothetical protein
MALIAGQREPFVVGRLKTPDPYLPRQG